ncbi:MAG: 16S rRNA (cytidine(1402)-2'-O)-methyltransferase [Oceanospirillaceae bacterium]|jgi:16S rRNA (cytidine1402-2'-O)-methyltransferase|uniref:16S rRNA (cytidine(1402)-2'-O)-methyltransferase n=1 Tax=Marinobacterium litorale TaxID=404770 RepID=UPI0004113B6E|nr:16S rRNA (cytidine(1402)-2'-O)-methyltransferase [Marinobacterium litorale]MBT00169.1 16S rRNA (cytidine(1402)-2'-O)-methyltransferase [Oceanospirillaceae bacterium]
MSEPILYIVATPIGNLGDLSPRAREVLDGVDLVAAEDTRHSGRLLAHFNIKVPMISVHDHNERQRADTVLERLRAGQSVALISDAGTPLISDPGFVLVRAVREAGFQVSPVPGCCAFIAALSASGLPSDRFLFEGFLPAKSSGRRQRLEALVDQEPTLIFYESTHRILASLTDMQAVFGGERYAVVARELTKTFETIQGDTLTGLVEWMSADPMQQKGEFVVMVQGAPKQEASIDAEVLRILNLLAQEMPPKKAAGLAAQITGLKKNALYQALLDQTQ